MIAIRELRRKERNVIDEDRPFGYGHDSRWVMGLAPRYQEQRAMGEMAAMNHGGRSLDEITAHMQDKGFRVDRKMVEHIINYFPEAKAQPNHIVYGQHGRKTDQMEYLGGKYTRRYKFSERYTVQGFGVIHSRLKVLNVLLDEVKPHA